MSTSSRMPSSTTSGIPDTSTNAVMARPFSNTSRPMSSEMALRRLITRKSPVSTSASAAGSARPPPCDIGSAIPATATLAAKTMTIAMRSESRGPTYGWRSTRMGDGRSMIIRMMGTTTALAHDGRQARDRHVLEVLAEARRRAPCHRRGRSGRRAARWTGRSSG